MIVVASNEQFGLYTLLCAITFLLSIFTHEFGHWLYAKYITKNLEGVYVGDGCFTLKTDGTETISQTKKIVYMGLIGGAVPLIVLNVLMISLFPFNVLCTTFLAHITLIGGGSDLKVISILNDLEKKYGNKITHEEADRLCDYELIIDNRKRKILSNHVVIGEKFKDIMLSPLN